MVHPPGPWETAWRAPPEWLHSISPGAGLFALQLWGCQVVGSGGSPQAGAITCSKEQLGTLNVGLLYCSSFKTAYPLILDSVISFHWRKEGATYSKGCNPLPLWPVPCVLTDLGV